MLYYGDVIMGAIASQITSLTIVYSTVYSDADQRKHQSSAVNSPHKLPVTRKKFPFDDVIMLFLLWSTHFLRRHFENEWKCINFYIDFTQICFYGYNQQYYSTGADNGLVPSRRQATIWTNDGQFTDAYMCHSLLLYLLIFYQKQRF